MAKRAREQALKEKRELKAQKKLDRAEDKLNNPVELDEDGFPIVVDENGVPVPTELQVSE